MESPRKYNDCYFYYYSTCTKGDNCVFRHEPTALGCETMCPAWQQGKCMDKRCKLRHMELRKNRKQIPCYWENQPGGCRKMHCPFMHKNPEARTDGIAPSQSGQPLPMAGHSSGMQNGLPNGLPAGMPNGLPAGMPNGLPTDPVPAEPSMAAVPTAQVPAAVPLMWQQQRQVIDSSMLGVLPQPTDLRRMLNPHAHGLPHPHAHHEPTPNPYAPMPVDPLVVNFEEESDNESAPSSTPIKHEDHSKTQELLLLDQIQAEAAAYYNYDTLPPAEPPKDRKLVRTNLTAKYDKVSLDEISGNKPERGNSLDFKVLSLDEIRARKTKSETLVPPITLNLRKRKLSTQETITATGNKILKVVSSNSIVYKKIDKNAPATSTQTKVQISSENECRKRTFSEQSDACEIQENELEDKCFEFKRIKVTDPSTLNKPKLIRNRNISENVDRTDGDSGVLNETIIRNADDSDNEVQIVSVDISNDLSLDKIYDNIEGEKPELIELVDSSDDESITVDLVKNVPDVVASCHRNSESIISEINEILDDDDDDL